MPIEFNIDQKTLLFTCIHEKRLKLKDSINYYQSMVDTAKTLGIAEEISKFQYLYNEDLNDYNSCGDLIRILFGESK
jgi:hypothetical protein